MADRHEREKQRVAMKKVVDALEPFDDDRDYAKESGTPLVFTGDVADVDLLRGTFGMEPLVRPKPKRRRRSTSSRRARQ